MKDIDFGKIMEALNGKGPDKPGDYCELDPENPGIVNFFHEDGSWWMSMLSEDYEEIKKREVSRED